MPLFVELLLISGTMAALAQNRGQITDVRLTSSNNVRLVVEPALPNPDVLLLQSADSPLGPWWKEPDFQRNPAPNGYEFLTPLKAYYPQRYYRFGFFSQSPAAGPVLPYIRFLSPNKSVQPGLSVSLLGANFAPTPGDNTVRFELPSQSWTATVTQAATNFLVVTVPTNLLVSSSGTGTVYRVTVTTSQGTGNGVGCSVEWMAWTTFMVRPADAFITQPPGSGKQTLVVGGGVPPYHLVPQTTNDLAVAVASLNGVVLDVVAKTNKYGEIIVYVEDSSVPAYQSGATVDILPPSFTPGFGAAFHTLLGGTAPGLTMIVTNTESSDGSLQIEQTELHLQNAGIEVSRLQPGQVVGLLKLFAPDNGDVYGFQHLVVKEVGAGRAKFDVVSLADGGVTTSAEGSLIENPPTVVIDLLNLSAVSLVPLPLASELIFADDMFRLPAGAGQSFSVTANFTSVSAREDKYLPQKSAITRSFTTTGLAAGAPEIDRLLPVQGEVFRNVSLRGAGFGATPADNTVTFTAAGGTNVPAEILSQTNGELVVTVPREAVSGPVRLTVGGKTSNDFQFSVRFHPETVLLFDSFTNNTPTPLRLMHQQPVDDGETAGEVPLQSVLCTLGAGQIVVTNLSTNQQVGTTITTSFDYYGTRNTNLIVYAGQETAPPQRYLFTEVRYVGSSYVLARLYYSENTNGVTLQLAGGDALFPFGAGGLYDFQFTVPIYRPPTAVGTDVAVRLETVSQQWMSIPGSEMRLIWNSTQRVQ